MQYRLGRQEVRVALQSSSLRLPSGSPGAERSCMRACLVTALPNGCSLEASAAAARCRNSSSGNPAIANRDQPQEDVSTFVEYSDA